MRMRRIGSLEVSVVGYGANNFTNFFGTNYTQADADRVIHAALDAGVNLIDTAEEYSSPSNFGDGQSEQFVGAALGSRRNDVIIASKFTPELANAPDERGAKRVVSAVEASLKRLGTDRIDLYQQHFPDPGVPIDDILEALDRLIRDGKVREIGCCNFSGEMIDEAMAASEKRGLRNFATVQAQYNLLDLPTEEGVLEACQRHGLMLLPFFPLASGVLTGKYKRGKAAPSGSRLEADTPINQYLKDKHLSDERIAKVEKLDEFAQDRGHTLLELAFSWLASQPFVASVIAGATSPEQIRANAAAADWELTSEDFAAVEAIVGKR